MQHPGSVDKAVPNGRRRNPRQTSAVFSMFTDKQIVAFKEAFQMIDKFNDGIISEDDVQDTFVRLGNPDSQQRVAHMMELAPTPLNFTMFLTMMADILASSATLDSVVDAIRPLDPKDTGMVSANQLRELVVTHGDRMTEAEFNEILRCTGQQDKQMINYRELAGVLVTGELE